MRRDGRELDFLVASVALERVDFAPALGPNIAAEIVSAYAGGDYKNVHIELHWSGSYRMRPGQFYLGGFIAPGTSHHPFAQEALDCAFRYPQDQAPAAVAATLRPEPNHARPIHEVLNDRRGIEAEPLSKGRGTVKGFVRRNVLDNCAVHKESFSQAGRKVNARYTSAVLVSCW
jgi:hypothetical protein